MWILDLVQIKWIHSRLSSQPSFTQMFSLNLKWDFIYLNDYYFCMYQIISTHKPTQWGVVCLCCRYLPGVCVWEDGLNSGDLYYNISVFFFSFVINFLNKLGKAAKFQFHTWLLKVCLCACVKSVCIVFQSVTRCLPRDKLSEGSVK